jgi:hypothetical protein
MLFGLIFIVAIFTLIYAILSCIDEYNTPLPRWYGVNSKFWEKFWKIIHAVARFIWIIFWGVWTILILCIVFGGEKKNK